MRIHHLEGVTLALLANAGEGFSVCLPEASIVLLDAFTQAFRASTGSVQTRLHHAFEVARERFAAREYEDIFEGGVTTTPPTGSLLAVAIVGKTACVVWLGNQVAFHVRGFQVTRTAPHTLREQQRAKDPTTRLSTLPSILLQGIRRDVQAQLPSTATFELLPGDSLVLTHGEHHVEEEVAFAAACSLSPQRAANRLANLALNDENWFATAMVLRFDDFDFAREIDRLIATHPNPWARAHQSLPLYVGYGCFFALTREGEVVAHAEDPRFKMSQEMLAAYELNHAIDASLTFPTMASLAPRRSPASEPCTRHMPADCPFCMNLGWLPPKRPERMK